MPKLAKWKITEGELQCLSSLHCIVSLHLVSSNIITTHFPASHYFLEPCSEIRGCSILFTETLEFIISSCIWDCMVEIKLRDVLLPQKQ